MNRPHEALKASGSQTRKVLALAAVILAAFALRIWLLGAQNVWWDEGLAIWAVRKGWVDMTLWTASDVHPPVYFWLLKAWVIVAGESEFAARFISLICGLVTVAALYPLGKLLLGRRVALGAMALLAFSRFHIWWSQEMRMYIVATLCGVLSLYTLLRWFRAEGWIAGEQPKRPHPGVESLLYVLATTAGLHTLYLFVAVMLIENLFFLSVLPRQSRQQRTASLVRWMVAQMAVLLLFVPWLALALPRMRSWSVAEPVDFRVFVQLYATLLSVGISTYIERYIWVVLPFFAVIAAAFGYLWRSKPARELCAPCNLEPRQTAFLLSLFLIIPPGIVYALTRPRGLFYAPNVEARYLILFAPAFYLLLAWSMKTLFRQVKWLGLAALAFVLLVFLWTLPVHYAGRYLRDEHQTMVRAIAAHAQPGDAVLLVSGNRYPVFEYYYGRLPNGPVRPLVYLLPQHALQISESNVEQELAPLAAAHSRLWLAEVNAPMQDPDGLVEDWLDRHYSRVLSFGFAHNALTLFAPAGEVASTNLDNLVPQHSMSASLAIGTMLVGYDLPTKQFRPGDTIRLALYYSSQTGAPVVVRLVDERGRVLEHRDSEWPPAQPIVRQQLDFMVFSHSPAGCYRFEVQAAGANQSVSLGSLRIAATQPLLETGTPPVIVDAALQGGIELLGYGLTAASGQLVDVIRPGETLTLDLYWRARTKQSRNYTVFAHMVGQAYNPATAGPVWAGHDSQPLDGGYPTAQWFANETIVDRHMLAVDPRAPDGEYELEVGMYLLQTMTRLPVVDAAGRSLADRIVLGSFRLVQP